MSWRHGTRFFVFLFLLVFGFTIWPLFDQCLDHLWVSLWVSLRSLLGPLEVLLEASGSKNTKKLKVFQGFWKCSFLALWSSGWLSWAHLAPSLADLVPKWAPKNSQNYSKSIPKFDHSFFGCFFSRPFFDLKNVRKKNGQSDFLNICFSFFLLILGCTYWPLFDQFLDHLWVSLWVSLGSLLGPLEVLLGSLWIQKH